MFRSMRRPNTSSGHSDVMMGVIVTNEKYWLPVRHTIADFGYCVSPDDCYLALRGFRTRKRAHETQRSGHACCLA